eukprot:TRINITY_DN4028_c0_g1_i2.p2 TRINITY_DN4028_c0_g1~~TRINITY_DN4028_c0_g1_i2.p2  ORF type:complete len:153 (+),score=6.10 TRINITY_DN4028_c0_g1_i2:377-835(+)
MMKRNVEIAKAGPKMVIKSFATDGSRSASCHRLFRGPSGADAPSTAATAEPENTPREASVAVAAVCTANPCLVSLLACSTGGRPAFAPNTPVGVLQGETRFALEQLLDRRLASPFPDFPTRVASLLQGTCNDAWRPLNAIQAAIPFAKLWTS